jgi:hypothetical protein
MTEPACRHRMDGLEPDNLLAFLALLGLLRSLEAARPEWRPRAAWDLDRAPLRPVLVLPEPDTRGEISEAAAAGADRLAGVYRFSAEKPGAAGQNDLNYSDEFARKLLSDATAEDGHERADLWAALMCDAARRRRPRRPKPPPWAREAVRHGLQAPTVTGMWTMVGSTLDAGRRSPPTRFAHLGGGPVRRCVAV